MKIWVDADACPVAIKEILFRAAEREQLVTTLVANQSMHTPTSPYIRLRQVPKGFDVADNEIVELCEANDLVITQDIPLAAEAIKKGALVITPRGERYTARNIQSRLSMRNFMDTLRSSGVETGGPPKLSQQDRQQFARELEKILLQHHRSVEQASTQPPDKSPDHSND